jgi:hypothetical protein
MIQRDQVSEENKEEEGVSDDVLDETIQVRRVRRANTQEPIYSQDMIQEPSQNADEDLAENLEHPLQGDTQAFDEHAQWQFDQNDWEEEIENEDRQESGDLSDSASVQTLYLSQQDTVLSPEENSQPIENESEDDNRVTCRRAPNNISFNPASPGSLRRYFHFSSYAFF